MKRAFSTLGCPTLDLESAQALAARNGIDAVELRVLERRLDLPAYLAERYGSPASLAQLQARAPAKIHSFSTSLTLARNTPADREAFLAHLPWAEALGVRWLRAFDGGGPGDEARVAETLAWWTEEKSRRGLRCDLMIETHDCLRDSEAIRRFLELAPSASLLLDLGNTWLHSGEEPLSTWEAARTHVVHMHVKDAVRCEGRPHPWRMVLPGQGEFPFRALLERLARDGYDGHVSLEWELHWHPELESLQKAIDCAQANGWL